MNAVSTAFTITAGWIPLASGDMTWDPKRIAEWGSTSG
jgi:hypothetical protein